MQSHVWTIKWDSTLNSAYTHTHTFLYIYRLKWFSKWWHGNDESDRPCIPNGIHFNGNSSLYAYTLIYMQNHEQWEKFFGLHFFLSSKFTCCMYTAIAIGFECRKCLLSLSLSWHYKHALSCHTHIGSTRVLWTFRINFWKTQHWIVCMACSCRVDGLSQVQKISGWIKPN